MRSGKSIQSLLLNYNQNLLINKIALDNANDEEFALGGLTQALNKTIFNAASKTGQRLRKQYLNKNYLEKLDETVDSKFVNLPMIKDLLDNEDISIKEATMYLEAGGYKKQVINKFIRPYKEIGVK